MSALVVTAIAQLTDPGPVGDLLLLAPAIVAFGLRALVPGLPAEAFAALVVGSVTLAVGRDGDLEASQFLIVVMVHYVSWHLSSMTRAGLILAVSAASP